jgi:hypothetical protein
MYSLLLSVFVFRTSPDVDHRGAVKSNDQRSPHHTTYPFAMIEFFWQNDGFVWCIVRAVDCYIVNVIGRHVNCDILGIGIVGNENIHKAKARSRLSILFVNQLHQFDLIRGKGRVTLVHVAHDIVNRIRFGPTGTCVRRFITGGHVGIGDG